MRHLVTILLVLIPSSAFGAITIDDFVDGPQTVSATFVSAPPPVVLSDSSGSGLSGVLGGQRDLILEIIDTGFTVGSSASVVATLSGGFLDIANGSTVVSRTSVVWDGPGIGGGAVGLGGIDLTEGGSPFVDSIAVVVDSIDIPPTAVRLTVEDSLGNSSTLSGFLNVGTWFFPYANFSDPSVFDDVDRITMMVTGVAGHDARISLVGTELAGGENLVAAVPEPATLAIWSLLGLCCAGGLGFFRRQALGGGRSPWCQENRQAIHALIDRGRGDA